jgi:hypothetical protein
MKECVLPSSLRESRVLRRAPLLFVKQKWFAKVKLKRASTFMSD